MKHLKHVASATALGVGALLLAPQEGQGWNLLGHSLGTNQRSVRMFDNFTNNAANNNVTEEANFPGYTGAELAFWKGCVEWGSGPHGDGTSSDTQANIGDGGANFDPSWQGNATAVGGPNDNIASEISGSDGGTFAFAESSSAGWRIRFYQAWNWADGPVGIGGNQTDIQGIGCHEYGHALGMAHSGTGAATMAASTFPGAINTRSIHSDDSAGIQALYGSVNPIVKPLISDVSLVDQEVTITGANFDDEDLEVWFTQKGIGGNGTPVKVGGVSSSAGGTVIEVTIPLLGGKGDILVKNPGPAAGNNLSNAWPFNGEGPDPTTPFVQLITPSQWPVLSAGNDMYVTIQGASLSAISSITVDGIALSGFPLQWNVVDDTELQMTVPVLENLTELGSVDLVLTNALGSTTVPVEIVAPSSPVLRLGEGNDPEGMNSFTPHVLRMGGEPGNVVFLWVSGSDLPTPVPGLFDLDIGNFATNLFYMGSFVIEPKGWATAQYQFSGLPFLTTIYWQGIEYDVLTPTFPVPETNVATGFWSF